MKRLPFFTKSQRRALLVLEWVLLLAIIGFSVWKWQLPSNVNVKEEKKPKWASMPAKPFKYAEEEIPVETFAFDPNTADSTTLLRLGLSRWQVKSIYRYRAKHGRYHTPEEFMNLPNMTVGQWERLRPYIRIAKEFQYIESAVSVKENRRQGLEALKAKEMVDSIDSFPRQPKILFGETIDINTADTTLLKMIPGIASKRAARIVAYRKALGGFVAVEQAMEAIEMLDSVLKYMTISEVQVAKINVNKLSVQRLMNHPYLNFYQAKAINEYRRNKGELHSIDELSRLEGFRPTDIDKLRPYMVFE